jgi:uncharacterized membrane protein
MTLPDERRHAIEGARNFLRAVAYDPKSTPRVPRQVRRDAFALLRHYPTDLDMRDVKRAFGRVPP